MPADPSHASLDLDVTLRGFVPGQKLFGRYTLTRILGRGGMGIVWLAHDDQLDREVALKFLPEIIVHDRGVVEDLKRETKQCLELTHKNIVRIYDLIQDSISACISMEYIDGDTLSNLRRDKAARIFEPDELKPWLSQLCEALDYAHNHARIIHRDLKPSNLMITKRGVLKIADFGIARSLTDSFSMLTHSTGTSGTLVYMSPQQLDGMRATHLDDIYSVGATIYELLTSKPPFYSGDISRQIHERIPPPMMQRRADLGIEGNPIPKTWEETIAACLAKNPANRPRTVMEVGSALGALGHSEPLPRVISTSRTEDGYDAAARSQTRPARARKNKSLIAFAAFILVGGFIWFLTHQPRHARNAVAETEAPPSATPVTLPPATRPTTDEQPAALKPFAGTWDGDLDRVTDGATAIGHRTLNIDENGTWALPSPWPSVRGAIENGKLVFKNGAGFESLTIQSDSSAATYEEGVDTSDGRTVIFRGVLRKTDSNPSVLQPAPAQTRTPVAKEKKLFAGTWLGEIHYENGQNAQLTLTVDDSETYVTGTGYKFVKGISPTETLREKWNRIDARTLSKDSDLETVIVNSDGQSATYLAKAYSHQVGGTGTLYKKASEPSASAPGELKKTASGLKYQVLTGGNGPRPSAADTVTINYNCLDADGKELDNSSWPGHTSTFPVREMTKGLAEGVQLMSVGSKYKLIVPRSLYVRSSDAKTNAPSLRLKYPLTFEIELLDVKTTPVAESHDAQQPASAEAAKKLFAGTWEGAVHYSSPGGTFRLNPNVPTSLLINESETRGTFTFGNSSGPGNVQTYNLSRKEPNRVILHKSQGQSIWELDSVALTLQGDTITFTKDDRPAFDVLTRGSFRRKK